MAISFSKISDPRFKLTDKLTFGKYQDCRVCDILEEGYEYVLWLHSKMQNFSPEVIEKCNQFKLDRVVEEEKNNNLAILKGDMWDQSWEEDIPF